MLVTLNAPHLRLSYHLRVSFINLNLSKLYKSTEIKLSICQCTLSKCIGVRPGNRRSLTSNIIAINLIERLGVALESRTWRAPRYLLRRTELRDHVFHWNEIYTSRFSRKKVLTFDILRKCNVAQSGSRASRVSVRDIRRDEQRR